MFYHEVFMTCGHPKSMKMDFERGIGERCAWPEVDL